MNQNQEWIVVGKDKKKNRNKKNYEDKIVWTNGPQYQIQKTEIDQEQFIGSNSYQGNYETIKKAIKILVNKNEFEDAPIYVECLGIGNFMKAVKSRFQYYFLKTLLIPLLKTEFPEKKILLNVYDPVLNKKCITQIQKLGGTFQERQNTNLQGITVFFMPHCERFLYESILKSQKTASLMIGNSIKEYIERCELISQKVPQVFKEKKAQEIKLIDYKESLNDTYVYQI